METTPYASWILISLSRRNKTPTAQQVAIIELCAESVSINRKLRSFSNSGYMPVKMPQRQGCGNNKIGKNIIY